MREDQTAWKQRTWIILHYIWQPRLALLSRFSCPEIESPNLRSRRLVTVFLAKGSERQANERLKHRKSWFHEKHSTYSPLNEYVDTCSTVVILAR